MPFSRWMQWLLGRAVRRSASTGTAEVFVLPPGAAALPAEGARKPVALEAVLEAAPPIASVVPPAGPSLLVGPPRPTPGAEPAAGPEPATEAPLATVSGNLDPERTRAAIRAAAAQGRFISYKDVALASGLAWSAPVNSAMPKHLEAVCRQGQREGVPMLSAIVVRVGEVGTGRLSDSALDGFIACAVRMGLDAAGDAGRRRRFLEEEQAKVFAWAKKERL